MSILQQISRQLTLPQGEADGLLQPVRADPGAERLEDVVQAAAEGLHAHDPVHPVDVHAHLGRERQEIACIYVV